MFRHFLDVAVAISKAPYLKKKSRLKKEFFIHVLCLGSRNKKMLDENEGFCICLFLCTFVTILNRIDNILITLVVSVYFVFSYFCYCFQVFRLGSYLLLLVVASTTLNVSVAEGITWMLIKMWATFSALKFRLEIKLLLPWFDVIRDVLGLSFMNHFYKIEQMAWLFHWKKKHEKI